MKTDFLSVPDGNDSDAKKKRRLWEKMSPIYRALFSTDGSFTLLLSALTGEPIYPDIVSQIQEPATFKAPSLSLSSGEEVLSRKVILKTCVTDRMVVYAESYIVLSRLEPGLSKELMAGNKPIGSVLRTHRLETFRELCDWGSCMNTITEKYFGSSEVLFRTYLIIAKARPVAQVTEYVSFHNPPLREGES